MPSSIGDLSELTAVRLAGNQLAGTLDVDPFLRLKNLQFVQLRWYKESTPGKCAIPTEEESLKKVGAATMEYSRLMGDPCFSDDQEVRDAHDNSRLSVSAEGLARLREAFPDRDEREQDPWAWPMVVG